MAGPPPKDEGTRRRRNAPERPWKNAPGVGWQHGDVPRPPAKLLKASTDAWSTWFSAWWAAFWGPEDLPGLRQVIRLYDQVERGEFQRAGELRLAMNGYGITPAGRDHLRWRPPKAEHDGGSDRPGPRRPSGRYGHLRPVDGGGPGAA